MQPTQSDHQPLIFDNRDFSRYTDGDRRMSMRGFEPQYTDIVDYIIRITHKIWEEKAVGYIYDTYQHNCVVHGSGGDVHGREAVVASTLQTLAAFPDRKLYGDNVIWSGDEDAGFHTSHLITSVGYNTGYSSYGPPTGRRITSRAIANCVSKENMIFEEWLLRDETSLIRQLGYDVFDVAERQVRSAPAMPLEGGGELGRALGQLPPPIMPPSTADGFDVEDFVRRSYHDIWNRRLLNKIREHYVPSYVCYTAGGRKYQGPAEQIAFVLGLFGMFPDAGVTVDHVYWNGDDASGYQVAVRWRLSGTHTGYGRYGEPSGSRVSIMGLSQHHVKQGKFVLEYTLFDEMELIRRIVAERLVRS